MLKKIKTASVGDESQNLIIHGDNLEALKAFVPYYGGKVKCVYIDPPYNTGNESWVYNDKVNSLKIKQWLGKVVGKELEDLTRHDKWLCMMYPRLKFLKDLMSDDDKKSRGGYQRIRLRSNLKTIKPYKTKPHKL